MHAMTALHPLPRQCPFVNCNGGLAPEQMPAGASVRWWIGFTNKDWHLIDAAQAMKQHGGALVSCERCKQLLHVHWPRT